MKQTTRKRGAVVCLSLALSASVLGCAGGIPAKAMELSPQSLQDRQLQTRRFDTSDERALLVAAVGLAQDLGYGVDATELKLGVVVASKDRDATDGGQIAGAVLIAALTGAATPVDSHQKIRLSVVTHPVGNSTALRVTFQRVVWNTQGQVSRLQYVNDPKIYQEFFEKLSKAVFLEGHEI